MNYNTDRPINRCDQDLLGRSPFAKQLGNAIFEYNGNDGLVIGIYGKWGTGKTSVINMAISELDNLSSNKDNRPITMRFAPWNYSDKDNLIRIFFKNLKDTINFQDNEELKKKVGKALNDYADALDAISVVPIVGPGVAALLKTITHAQGKKLMQGASLDKTREKLEKALRETNKKIIIVIDDIDRLTNSQIRDIFQLVKQVADFPNVIYLLSMDRDVVRSALSEVHNIDGDEYLEKIIQIPFELPELRKAKLHEIFFVKLDQIIQELPMVVLDKEYWSNVFRNCIEPYIITLRDINRVINTFQFKCGMLYQETSFEDMVGITTIEVLEPALYKWISNNKEAVCGGLLHGFLSVRDQKIDYRKQYSEEFLKLGINPEKAIKCVSTMFPVFAKDVDENVLWYQNSSEIRGKMRAAHEERFELYFMFDLDGIKVPRNIVNACVYDYDAEALGSVFKRINEQGNIVYFLEEIRALTDSIPYDRLGILASALMDYQGDFQGESTRSIVTFSASDIAICFVQEIIRKLKTEDERFSIIHHIVEHIGKNGIGALARIILTIESGYGRLTGRGEKETNQIIRLDQLQNLESLFVSKIKSIIATESILDLNGFVHIIYLWELFDKEGAEKYIDNLFSDESQKLKFICAMAGRWNGANGSGWHFPSSNYSSYLSDAEIYELIQKYDKKKIDVFSDVERVKLASFVLNYQKDEMDYVNEQEAMKLVEEWKHDSCIE
ncbi:MAG: AAA family ATPase [Erysipelotrichaceae bacterium]|nr:AAA family ATPase [Erysipelotrichaceae bacterium]